MGSRLARNIIKPSIHPHLAFIVWFTEIFLDLPIYLCMFVCMHPREQIVNGKSSLFVRIKAKLKSVLK